MKASGLAGALALVLIASGGDAGAQQPPGCSGPPAPYRCAVQVALMGDIVTAWGYTPGADVQFEIRNSGGSTIFGPATRRTDASGNFFLSRAGAEQPGHGHDFTGGEVVTATDVTTGTAKTLVVPPLAVTNVDATTETVSGRARPGDSVDVTLGPPLNTMRTVAASGAGDWSVSFSPDYNIEPGTQIGAQVTEPDWDLTQANPSGCPPYSWLQCSIIASIEADAIGAFAFTPNSDVTFEVFDSAGTRVYGPVTKRTDSQTPLPPHGLTGWYILDLGLDPGDPDLVPGSRVVVTDVATSTVKTVTLIDLEVSSANPDTELVEGRAPPGTVVEVSAMNRHLGELVTADGNGLWSLDMSSRGGVGPQDWFIAHHRDRDFDETADDQGSPVANCKPGPTTVCGTAGEDTLRAGAPAASPQALRQRRGFLVKAGLRDDTILFRVRRSGKVTIDAGPGGDAVLLDARRNPRTTSFVLVNGGSGNELVILPARPGGLKVRVVGGSGNDEVRTRRIGRGGPRGSYRLEGGPGNDRLTGGSGSDDLIGGPGRDTCFKGRGDTVRSCEKVRRAR